LSSKFKPATGIVDGVEIIKVADTLTGICSIECCKEEPEALLDQFMYSVRITRQDT